MLVSLIYVFLITRHSGVRLVLNSDMWPYLLMFLVPAYLSLVKERKFITPMLDKRWPSYWRITFVLVTLMIGFRHQVGGDWGSYLANVEATSNITILEALNRSRQDPADSLISWLATHSGTGVYLVNLIYGGLFTFGLIVFCHKQPRPWLAFVVAVPYLITVVAMGYSRQGVAIGIVMLGLVALEKNSVYKFLLWVSLAALFHKSAIILMPIAALASSQRRLFTLFWISVSTSLLFALILQEYVDDLFLNYLGSEYESTGASIRIAMNALPAVLFLVFCKRFKLEPAQRKFWTYMAWAAIAFILLLYVSPSSTAVDRVALYFIPLQLFVWSRIPDSMARNKGAILSWIFAIVCYCALVYFVWMFFAIHAFYWLPYQFFPWVWLWN